MSGIYIHIPFCSSFCTYCGFYSVTGKELADRYLDTLSREMVLKKDFLKAAGVSPETVYIGGGTPSLLSLPQLEKLTASLERTFGSCASEEFTIEVNPDDISLDYARGLKSLGISRVSMGVQSFHDRHLKWMNRRHSADEARKAYDRLRKAGFDNLSLDLIFGYAALSLDEWRADLREMVRLHPEHISSYQMSIEEDSRLYRLCERGLYQEPGQEICSEQYSILQHMLAEGGYHQYEISNFALPGKEARHNSSYWERAPYLGLGPAAHSFDGRTRSWNAADVKKYIEGGYMAPQGQETLSPEEVEEEVIMLGLRRTEGLPAGSFPDAAKVAELMAQGLLENKKGRIRIPPDKLFISDYIIPLAFR